MYVTGQCFANMENLTRLYRHPPIPPHSCGPARTRDVSTGSPAELTGNALLDSLTKRLRSELVQACERVDLKVGQSVCKPDEQIRHVYFPRSGYISVITSP